MVSATRVPNNLATSYRATGSIGVSRVVDRLIAPSAHYLASSGIGSARLQLSCSPCLADLLDRAYQDGGRGFHRVSLPCQHNLPGDARRLVGQRHRGQLRRLALEKLDKP